MTLMRSQGVRFTVSVLRDVLVASRTARPTCRSTAACSAQEDCDVLVTGGGKPLIAGDHLAAVSTGESKQITVGDLSSRFRLPQFEHHRGRDSVGPEEIPGARYSQLQQRIEGRPRRAASERKLCTDADNAELSERTSRPSLNGTGGGHPPSRQCVMLVRRHQQGDEHVDVGQADHY